MTNTIWKSRPEIKAIFRMTNIIWKSRPEKTLISRIASHFEPPRPEKPLISRTASHFETPRPEINAIFRTGYFMKCTVAGIYDLRLLQIKRSERVNQQQPVGEESPWGVLPAADLSCSCRKSYTPTAVLTDRLKIGQTRRVFQRVFVIRELCETYHLRQIRLPEVPLRWSGRLDPKGRPPNERYL